MWIRLLKNDQSFSLILAMICAHLLVYYGYVLSTTGIIYENKWFLLFYIYIYKFVYIIFFLFFTMLQISWLHEMKIPTSKPFRVINWQQPWGSFIAVYERPLTRTVLQNHMGDLHISTCVVACNATLWVHPSTEGLTFARIRNSRAPTRSWKASSRSCARKD